MRKRFLLEATLVLTAALLATKLLFMTGSDSGRFVNFLYELVWLHTGVNEPVITTDYGMNPDCSWWPGERHYILCEWHVWTFATHALALKLHAASMTILFCCCFYNAWNNIKGDLDKHRKIGRIAMSMLLIANLSSLPLSYEMHFGDHTVEGFNMIGTALGFFFMAFITILCGFMGWKKIVEGDVASHALWMDRLYWTLMSGFWTTRGLAFIGPLNVPFFFTGGAFVWIGDFGGIAIVEIKNRFGKRKLLDLPVCASCGRNSALPDGRCIHTCSNDQHCAADKFDMKAIEMVSSGSEDVVDAGSSAVVVVEALPPRASEI